MKNSNEYKDYLKEDSHLQFAHKYSETEDFEPDVEKAWKKVYSKLNVRQHKFSFLKIASVFLLFLSFTAIVYTYFNNLPKEIVVENTQPTSLSVKLPDDSYVYLNQNTKISYLENFQTQRNIKLEGEAYFEVTKSKTPFIVEIGTSKVEVLGTSFNVKDQKSQIEVSVFEGLVQFNFENQIAQISKGEKAVAFLDSHSVELSKFYGYNSPLWFNNGEFVFNDIKLEKATQILANYFNVTIVFKNEELKNCKISGTFKNDQVSEILNSISVVLKLSVQSKENKFILSGKGC